MRCKKATRLLSDLYNGELDKGTEKALADHLDHCPECFQAKMQFHRAMESVAKAGLPELPDNFSSDLHMKLVREAEAIRDSEPHVASGFGRKTVLKKALLVLCGAAAMWILGFLVGTLRPQQVPQVDSKRSRTVATSVKPAREVGPKGLGDAGKTVEGPTVPVETIAVLTVTVHASSEMNNVRFQVVLPDGVAFVGHSSRVLQERVMTWNGDLKQGENVVRIPIRAQRVGKWLLVARATKGRFKFVSEKVLVVTET